VGQRWAKLGQDGTRTHAQTHETHTRDTEGYQIKTKQRWDTQNTKGGTRTRNDMKHTRETQRDTKSRQNKGGTHKTSDFFYKHTNIATMIGHVYKLHNRDESVVYIGSTMSSLDRRWQQHKCNSKSRDISVYRFIREQGIDNFEMTLLHTVDVESRDRLRELEQRAIESHACVNRNKAYRDPNIDHSIVLREQRLCGLCNRYISLRNMARHRTTQQHIRNV
jgi:NAD+--asparagine ADP-ribosyltransferase